jgi:prepilin-type N-terminal cleavage/methylation domain-containing protein
MSRNKGFTLVEILVATAIFAVVITTVYSAFHTGIFGYRNIERNIEINQAVQQILECINLDLRNAFVYSSDESRFQGEAGFVSFLTLVDSYRKDKIVRDYALVSYSLEKNKIRRLCRKGKESLNARSEITAEEMASNMDMEIKFQYGYLGKDKETEWLDSWPGFVSTGEEGKGLPLAVKVKLTVKNKTEEVFERTIFLPNA